MTLHAGMKTPMQWQAMQGRLAELEAENARLREAVGELERAWAFHDRVVASSPAERSAVGQDHFNWCERAARNAIRALQP